MGISPSPIKNKSYILMTMRFVMIIFTLNTVELDTHTGYLTQMSKNSFNHLMFHSNHRTTANQEKYGSRPKEA